MTTEVYDNKNEVDFLPFCDDESIRVNMSIPWVKDGFRYATNSRIMVMQFTGEPDTPEGEKPFPNAASVRDSFLNVNANTPWPESFPDCPTCGKSGMVEVFECGNCGGMGYQECNLGHEHDCDFCDGTGNAKGRFRRGESRFDICDDMRRCAVKIGGRSFQRYLIRMIEDHLPGPFVYAVKSESEDNPAIMVIECGEGIRAILAGLDDKRL